MPTAIEYALMAGAAYVSTRAPINQIPSPVGWLPRKRERQDGSGFEASSFVNGTETANSTEIVISYAGTYPTSSGDWFNGNIPLALGGLADQLREAADYYLAVKASAPAGANITFTGHSLGGGLASLMAVFFGESAFTFDQAPFRNSALTFTTTDEAGNTVVRSVAQDLRDYLVGKGADVGILAPLDSFIEANRPDNGNPVTADTLAMRESNVSNINVQGEVLGYLGFSRIGTETDIATNDYGVSSIQLHDQTLLTALLQSNQTAARYQTLSDATFKLPDLLKMIFDENLYAKSTGQAERNFLEHLVRHEAGVRDPATGAIVIAADAMLTRFTKDMAKIAQPGGLTMIDDPATGSNWLSKALILFAMQKYYDEVPESAGYKKELFSDVSGGGGIQFDIKDVAPNWADTKDSTTPSAGYMRTFLEQYYTTVSSDGDSSSVTYDHDKDYILASLNSMRHWYIQAGTGGMDATDTKNEGAFMFGGSGNDNLTGGAATDLLVGNAGNDRLNGGGGNDTLLGGKGDDTLDGGAEADTYVYGTGGGADTITDQNAGNKILVEGTQLSGTSELAKVGAGNTHVWTTADEQFTYRFDEKRKSVEVTGNALGGGDSNSITLTDIADLKTLKDRFGIELTLEAKVGLSTESGNVFADASGTPGDGETTITENASKLLNISFNQALKFGDTVTLAIASISGVSLDLIKAVTGDEVLSFSSGDISLAATEGQNYVSLAILEQEDVSSDATVTFKATLNTIDENGDALTVDSNLFTFNIRDVSGAMPDDIQTDNTIVGDFAAKEFFDSDGNVIKKYDDLGNLITDPDKPEARDDTLFDGYGNDLINAGDGNDFVWEMRGGNDVINLGGGDDDLHTIWGPTGRLIASGGDGSDYLGAGSGRDIIEGGAGADGLYGSSENDRLYGDARGNAADFIAQGADQQGTGQKGEWFDAEDGNDQVFGGAGNDFVAGGGGDDLIVAGGGRDYIWGDWNTYTPGGQWRDWSVTERIETAADGSLNHIYDIANIYGEDDDGVGDDVIYAGAGDDFVLAERGNDTVYLEAGNDSAWGDDGDDVLLGGAGDDVLNGDNTSAFVALALHGSDFLDGGEGNDGLFGSGGADVLYGGAGDDIMSGDSNDENAGDDYLDGEDGSDMMVGAAGDDSLFGGDGDDQLFGDSSGTAVANQGDDYLDGEGGNDTLAGSGGDDTLFGGDGNDTLLGDSDDVSGDDYLDGEAGDDILIGKGGRDVLNGGDGADQIAGDMAGEDPSGDADMIDGGAGNDLIDAQGGDDIVDAGADIDTVFGGAGNDQIAGGAGNDWIQGGEDNDLADGGDGDDVLFGESGDDLLEGGLGIDYLLGGDGNDTLSGGEGQDVLFGDAGDDILQGGSDVDYLLGGAGDDTLNGGEGDDVFYVYSGEGIDHIADSGGTDWLVLPDINLSAVTLGVGSLKLTVPGGEIHLDDFDPDNPYAAGGIEYFQFADTGGMSKTQLINALGFKPMGTPDNDVLLGTSLADDIQALAGNDEVTARAGNDTINLDAGDDYADAGAGNDLVYAGDGADQVIGGDGDDTVYGGAGDDYLSGNAGNDSLYGDAGNDVLAGGAGSDTLDGGEGDDTFLFSRGDGGDVATDGVGSNQVELGSGMTADDVVFSRQGDALLISVEGASDRLTVNDWFAADGHFSNLVLGDGTTLDHAEVEALMPSNQAPLMTADAATAIEDSVLGVSGNALANDADPEGRSLRITNAGTYAGAVGTLALNSTGSFTYSLDNASAAVQSLAAGEVLTESFAYTATDDDPNGAASAQSSIVVSVKGANDLPVLAADAAATNEDSVAVLTGNVLANDHDIDNGAVLSVANPGNRAGLYGSLNLGAAGAYSYQLNTASANVQALGAGQVVTDNFAESISDGIAQVAGNLAITITGANDAPIVQTPLLDQNASANSSWTWQLPAGSFADVDSGDALTYSASLSDGTALPSWLSFSAATQTFSGRVPKSATGTLELRVNADDRLGARASDVFTLAFDATSGGGGGGGGSGGNGGGSTANEGVGNGVDAPPPGHDLSFNDGAGTGPGNPGAQGGNGYQSVNRSNFATKQGHIDAPIINERLITIAHGSAASAPGRNKSSGTRSAALGLSSETTSDQSISVTTTNLETSTAEYTATAATTPSPSLSASAGAGSADALTAWLDALGPTADDGAGTSKAGPNGVANAWGKVDAALLAHLTSAYDEGATATPSGQVGNAQPFLATADDPLALLAANASLQQFKGLKEGLGKIA